MPPLYTWLRASEASVKEKSSEASVKEKLSEGSEGSVKEKSSEASVKEIVSVRGWRGSGYRFGLP
jgi:hypothetical protein